MRLTTISLSLCALAVLGGTLLYAQSAPEDRQAETEPGKKLFNQCRACHTLDRTGDSGAGPNLYGVVGRRVGMQAEFAYSSALLEKNVKWTQKELDNFLKSPGDYAPGTTMAYSGMKDAANRKALIEYLKTMAPTKQHSRARQH